MAASMPKKSTSSTTPITKVPSMEANMNLKNCLMGKWGQGFAPTKLGACGAGQGRHYMSGATAGWEAG